MNYSKFKIVLNNFLDNLSKKNLPILLFIAIFVINIYYNYKIKYLLFSL